MTLLLLLPLLLAAWRAPAPVDEIVLWRGDVIAGVTVIQESCDGLTFRKRGASGEQTIAAGTVRDVRYSKRSKWFAAGDAAWKAGDQSKAAGSYIAAAAAAKNWEKPHALFRVAECRRLSGQFVEAITAYQELLRQVPATRFLGDCLERIAACERALGNIAAARKSYQELASPAASRKLGDRYPLLAALRLLELDEFAGGRDPAAALAAYLQLQASAIDHPDIANMARLRVGCLLLQRGEPDRARIYFEDVIKEREASELVIVAGAYNGLGATFLAKEQRKPADYDAALFPFLRTVFHYGDQLAGSELLAEALYQAGVCLAARPGADDQESAKLLLRRCQDEFPASEWAKKARLR
ncbi:MAG: tetratricopeptide repeat protein [Myxococcales bacterium]|nr:tetratricopeptide repeat protein [Myxococcales bacterium]